MTASETPALSLGSYDTALCIIPPREAWPAVENLRSLYDDAYGRWPPHVNICYPFVQPEALPRAAALLQTASSERIKTCLNSADIFVHKHKNTLFIHDSDEERSSQITNLRTKALAALGQQGGGYRLHMTIAQNGDSTSSTHRFLLDKLRLLPPLAWEVDKLYIMIRERSEDHGNKISRMKLWGTIDILDGSLSRSPEPIAFYEPNVATSEEQGAKEQLQTQPCYYYEPETCVWMSDTTEQTDSDSTEIPNTVCVASYNVLAEFDHPPSQARYPLILKNLLSQSAVADILVLQEVTDDFLSFLLQDEQIRKTYDFCSHGPPDQSDIVPLPSHLNIVILSKLPFEWEWVPFLRRHKGSVVATFKDMGRHLNGSFLPLILSGIHLSHGLTDGAVTAKKGEIQRILNYLQATYPRNPLILAGDTNISTSTHTIEAALKKKAISDQSATYLEGLQRTFYEAGLADTWAVSRSQVGDTDFDDYLYEGEQGATYDPSRNDVAANIAGNLRPQRYDRILVRSEGFLTVKQFNKFGFLKEATAESTEPTLASDHWGVRCSFGVRADESKKGAPVANDVSHLTVPIQHKKAKAPSNLDNVDDVKDVLASLQVLPSDLETGKRRIAFSTLEHLIRSAFDSSPDTATRRLPLVIEPVGSYGLDVWTPSSDIDCLCIGPFGTYTFFAVVTQHLKKSKSEGIKILRRVKANTGTMLELEVDGIKVDLQYCSATSVAEQFPQVLRAPVSHPVWSLSPQSLSKLKAIRDSDYLRRSTPDLVKFRLAHRFVRTWAKSRGIYSAKFGYLGGIHISVLLACVCKSLALDPASGSISVADILSTFFNHFASFDWKHSVAFDPFFHKTLLQYTRTAREPLSILGYFPPNLNVSHAASVPSVNTIAAEFQRANDLLLAPEVSWNSFLCSSDAPATADSLHSGSKQFLTAFKSYVKIEAQYWGSSSSRAAQFIGWLESRCVSLLVDINRRLPLIHARIWPEAFVSPEDIDYQCRYLVALDRIDPEMSRDELKLALGSLHTVLHRFEELIRGDEKYFDAKTCWMSASVVNAAEVKDLKVDTRNWGSFTQGEDESDDDDEDEALLAEASTERRAYVPLTKKHQKHPSEDIIAPRLEPGKKFRTALDVLNRLRWDPELDSSDYIVGYEDRFLGAMEKDLASWKGELTDEEFIPQHRILWFKKKDGGDGVVLWDRRSRKDDIFGSGL